MTAQHIARQQDVLEQRKCCKLNRLINSARICVEHAIGKLKTYSAVSSKWRHLRCLLPRVVKICACLVQRRKHDYHCLAECYRSCCFIKIQHPLCSFPFRLIYLGCFETTLVYITKSKSKSNSNSKSNSVRKVKLEHLNVLITTCLFPHKFLQTPQKQIEN